MKGFEENKSKKKTESKLDSKPSHKKIIDQAIKLHLQGNISEAAKYYQYFPLLFYYKLKLLIKIIY